MHPGKPCYNNLCLTNLNHVIGKPFDVWCFRLVFPVRNKNVHTLTHSSFPFSLPFPLSNFPLPSSPQSTPPPLLPPSLPPSPLWQAKKDEQLFKRCNPQVEPDDAPLQESNKVVALDLSIPSIVAVSATHHTPRGHHFCSREEVYSL